MNWSALRKEQKQYVFLGVVVCVGSLYGLFSFVVFPFFGGWGETKLEYSQMKSDLEDAHDKVVMTSKVLTQLDESFTNLSYKVDVLMPPRDNPLTWVTERIYAQARRSNLDVESIGENPVNTPWGQLSNSPRRFGIYGVRVLTSCGYNELRQFITDFCERNPMAVVSGIKVTAGGDGVERHRIQLFLEWPIWLKEDGADAIRSSQTEQEGDAA